LCLLSGSLFINLAVILIDIFFIIEIYRKKIFPEYKNIFFILLSFFYCILILNIFFNTGDVFSFERQIGFIRFFIFVFALKYYLIFSSKKYFDNILNIWFIFFLIVTFDIYFEFIFGFNILGNVSYMEGRLSSFLGAELKIGNFYNGFIFLIISHLILKKRINLYTVTLIIVFFTASFIIGERSNFLKIFIGFVLFIFLAKQIKYKTYILSSLILISFSIGLFNKSMNTRINQIVVPVKSMGIVNYVKTSHYGVHYDTAYKIFLRNKIFGVGLKQFRNESRKEIYKDNVNNIYNRDNWATHPHQVHFELLSETGIIGYISFIIIFMFAILLSFRKYLENRNIYLLSGLIFVVTSLIPILPSGSFFTTYTATIFWINFAVMISFYKKNSLK
tara:strand:- start:295 stop:1464 length:1170 start_codon:yes stop_codon:yes gene_type:complete